MTLRQKGFSTKWFSRQSVVRRSVVYPIHVLFMTSIEPLHVQDTGQYYINTESSTSLQLQVSFKDLYVRAMQILIFKK